MAASPLRSLLRALERSEPIALQKRRARIAALACALSALAVFTVDRHVPLGVAVGVLYAIAVLMSLWIPSQSPFALALLTSALTLAGMLKRGGVAPDWAMTANRALSITVQLAAAGAVALYREQDRQRRDLLERTRRSMIDLKRLEGLLPICAWCKRIRDESGAWQRLEVYVSERSEAEFSHGACPECAERVMAEANGLRASMDKPRS